MTGRPQLFRGHPDDRDQVGRSALSSMGRPEFLGVGAVFAPLNYLPIVARLFVLAGLVLVGMVACSAAWVDQQHYQPSPNICAPSQVQRTDCVHVERAQLGQVAR